MEKKKTHKNLTMYLLHYSYSFEACLPTRVEQHYTTPTQVNMLAACCQHLPPPTSRRPTGTPYTLLRDARSLPEIQRSHVLLKMTYYGPVCNLTGSRG